MPVSTDCMLKIVSLLQLFVGKLLLGSVRGGTILLGNCYWHKCWREIICQVMVYGEIVDWKSVCVVKVENIMVVKW